MASKRFDKLFAERAISPEKAIAGADTALLPWKVLIVDDDNEVHALTKLVLSNFSFEGRSIDFISAYSGQESMQQLRQHDDIAMVLLDVVMETEHAGLDVARQIRETLGNQLTRIILRTGQPGQAPEEQVIIDYDINDYKGKSDLTAAKLKTMTVAALRGYRDLCRLDTNRQRLMNVSRVSSSLFQLQALSSFPQDILLRLISLWPPAVTSTEIAGALDADTPGRTEDVVSGLVAFECNGVFRLMAGSGIYARHQGCALKSTIPESVLARIRDTYRNEQNVFQPNYSLLCITPTNREHRFIVYLEACPVWDEWEKQLIGVLCGNIASTYDNVWLLSRLENLNQSLESKVLARTKQLESAKAAAEAATDAKSLFLANISHEIRTPLNAILGFAQLSLRSRDLPKRHGEMLQAIETAGNHLLEVINDVLELSKIEAGAMRVDVANFELSQLINDLATMFGLRCEQKGLSWQLTGDFPQGSAVTGDQGKLRQVLVNLLGNAIKFTEHGSIGLAITHEGGDRYRFAVRDTGPGIAAGDQVAIFDAFHQADGGGHKTGTGLGLAISRRQVELMGGRLEVSSAEGEGSEFSFRLTLPQATDQTAPRPRLPRRISRLKAGFRLAALVVDDVRENRVMLSRLLDELGIDVTEAVNGQEALASLREKPVDIVFMDIRMPVMNGDEAVKLIRREFQEVKIACVAISAYSMAHEVEYYLSVGFDRYLSKPFQFDEIYQTLQTLCGVEFDVEPVVSSTEERTSPEPTMDFAHLTLSRALYSDLMEAVELNRVTKIRQLLDEVEATPNGGADLSAHLSLLLANYDTQGMVETLRVINHQNGS